MLVCEVFDAGAPSVKKTDTVRTIAMKMIGRGSGVVPVVDGDKLLVGVVSLQDIMLPIFPNFGDYIHDHVDSRDFEQMEDGYRDILNRTAADVMTANPMTVSLYDPVLKAVSCMGLKNLRRIPVVEDGKYMGVVSLSDIGTALFFRSID